MSFHLDVDGRDFRDVIGILEGLSLVGQVNVPEMFTDRIKKFSEFTDAGVFHGAYGARVHGRLGDLVSLLERDPDTRQAVLTIYDSRSDLGVTKRDVPCTVALQFMLGPNGLDMKVMMRSNDAWLGMPYDLVQFSILQGAVAQALGVNPNIYVHSVGSLHIYDRDLSKINDLGNADYTNTVPFPLFGGEGSIADIGMRARRMLVGGNRRFFSAETEFERWAVELLAG